MSKTLALLKHFEGYGKNVGPVPRTGRKKNGDCHRMMTVTSTMPAFGLRAKTLSFWIISVIIVLLLLILLIFNQKLYSMIKENTAENFATGEKLNKIENILTDYSRQASVNSDIIHKLSGLLDVIDTRLKDTEDNLAKLKETNEEKFTQLKEATDTQVSAMQSLTKETDRLTDKISSLETEIEKIKAKNATHAAAASNVTTATSLIE